MVSQAGAAVLDANTPVYGLGVSQLNRRILAVAWAAGLGDGFTGHSGRVGMAQDLAATGVELDGTADRGAVEKLPGCRQGTPSARPAAWRSVARYYQESRG